MSVERFRFCTRSFASWWKAAVSARGWFPLALTAAILLVAVVPPLRCSTVAVQQGPSPLLRVQQKAVIRALFDGAPYPGVRIELQQGVGEEVIAVLTTGKDGVAALPELPPGTFFIGRVPAQGFDPWITVRMCVAPCPDEGLETIPLVTESLRGQWRPVDRDAFALSEIRLELAPDRIPEWRAMVESAEQQNAPVVSAFRGTVQDGSGAVIPGVRIDVVVKRTEGRKHAALLTADNIGKFAVDLPEGDYIAVISSPGFRVRTLPFRITGAGPSTELRLVLEIASFT